MSSIKLHREKVNYEDLQPGDVFIIAHDDDNIQEALDDILNPAVASVFIATGGPMRNIITDPQSGEVVPDEHLPEFYRVTNIEVLEEQLG